MLINLVAIHTCPSPQAVPLANAFLKSIVRETAINVALHDFFISDNPDELASLLTAVIPDAVGFSMYVWNRTACLNIATELRKRLPAVLIFAGGPEVTADPAGVLNSGVLDLIITGEGEIPFAALCENLIAGMALSDIPGVILPGKVPLPSPIPIANLDTIPSPYLNGILDTRNFPGILWQLARGCSFACDFCFDARDNHGVRRFSLERVETELRHFAAIKVAQVFVLDSTFNQDAKRAKRILRLIKKIAHDIHFHFEVRSEFIDREMAELFAQITCSLQIGLQSSDPDVLKQVGRSFNRDDFTRRISLLNDCGAVFGFDLIYGLPGDTLSGFCSSLDYALSLYPNHLDIFPLAVLPGTKLASQGLEHGLLWDPSPPYTLLSTETFNRLDLKTAGQLAKAVDIFFTRGKAVAWFNAVICSLKLKPSKFMQIFSEWLTANKGSNIVESDLNDDHIWELQRSFLRKQFGQKNMQRFLPIVLDLVDYHHYYAVALLAPQTEKSIVDQPGTKNLKAIFRLADSARLAHFHYEIQDILDSGEPNISSLYQKLQPAGSHAVIYPNNGYVCTESLDPAFYAVLEQFDGKTTTEKLLHKLGLTLDDTLEFIVFAMEEGIIVLTGQ